MKTVLVIDNNEDYKEGLREALEEREIDMVDADCPDEAYKMLFSMDAPDMIVSELSLPFTNVDYQGQYKDGAEVGVKTLRELAWVFPEMPVIALTKLEVENIKRIKKLIDPIPMYHKSDNMYLVADILEGFIGESDWGPVQ